MKKSLVSEIIDYGRSSYPNFISTIDIEKLGHSLGFSAYNSKRRMQELVARNIFEKDLFQKKYGRYRYIMPKPKTEEQVKEESEKLLIQALL
jgi:predicted transcriptional regulator